MTNRLMGHRARKSLRRSPPGPASGRPPRHPSPRQATSVARGCPLGAVTSRVVHQGGPASSSSPRGAYRLSYRPLAGFGNVNRLVAQPDGVSLMDKLHDYLRIQEAAAFLGVSPN